MPYTSSHRGRQGNAGGFRGRGQQRGPGCRRPSLGRSASSTHRINHTSNLISAVHHNSHRGQDGSRDPRTSSFRGSVSRSRGRHRSHSRYTGQNRNASSNQRHRQPLRSLSRPQYPRNGAASRQYQPYDRHLRHQRQEDSEDRRAEYYRPRSREVRRPTTQQGGPYNNHQQDGQFRSLNPDFRLLVRAANNGARLLNHMDNWERIPQPIDRAIDDLTTSIRPPLVDDSFSAKINNIAEQYRANIHRTVNQHLIKKYTETCRNLAVLDDTDMSVARQIARKQLMRSNRRIDGNRAHSLISAVLADTRDHLISGRVQSPSNPPANDWQQPKNPAAGQHTSSSQEAAPLQTSNRFQALTALGDHSETDQMEAEALIDLLDNTMEDPTKQSMSTQVKRPISRRSPNSASPPNKTRLLTGANTDEFARPATVRKTRGLPSGPSPYPGDAQPPSPSRAGRAAHTSNPTTGSGNVPTEPSEPDIEVLRVMPTRSPVDLVGGMRPASASLPQRQRQTSEPVRRSTTQSTSATENGVRTVPSSPASEDLPLGTRLRLSLFNANHRRSWTWPTFRTEEDTVVLTDSNGIGIAQHTPNTWRVVAFRGGLVEDASRILSDSPLPASIRNIIIFMGINNRDRHDPLLVSHLSRLRDVLAIQTRRVTVVPLPALADEPPSVQTARQRFNGALQDLLAIPTSLLRGRLSSKHTNFVTETDSVTFRRRIVRRLLLCLMMFCIV